MTSRDDLIRVAEEAATLLASISDDISALVADGLPRSTSKAAIASLKAVASRSDRLSRLITEELDLPTVDASFLQRLLGLGKNVAVGAALGAAALGGLVEGGGAALVQARLARQSESLAVTCTVATELPVASTERAVLVDGQLHLLDESAGMVIGAHPRRVAAGDRLVSVGPDVDGVDDSQVRLSIRDTRVLITDVGAGRPTFLVGREGTAQLLTSLSSTGLDQWVAVRFGSHEIRLVE